jgi:RHS repeat-associated protein
LAARTGRSSLRKRWKAYVTGDINGDGNVDQVDFGILMAAYGKCQGESGYNAAANLSDASMCSSDPNLPVIDQADLGVLLSVYGLQATGAIRAKFTWDAENRLVGWEPLLFVSGAKKVTFVYDYFGRRIEKKVYTYNGSSWDLSETRRFIWNNWLLLLELDGDGNVLRKLTWGRDLSGSLDGAGGIGGLLAVHDPAAVPDPNDPNVMLPGDFIFFYDANGNVGQVIDLSFEPSDPNDPNTYTGAIKARYEYDPYGNSPLDVNDANQSGPYASANPYRFSTKPWDDETALGSWGQRYYDPRLGRWINHDPIGELGGTAPKGPPKVPNSSRTPSSGPATSPGDCDSAVAAAKGSAQYKELVAKFPAGCSPPEPTCEDCSKKEGYPPGAKGGYDWKDNSITMCAGSGVTAADVLHEMWHALQDCGKPGGKDTTCTAKADVAACLEIQAIKCSGQATSDDDIIDLCVLSLLADCGSGKLNESKGAVPDVKCPDGAFGDGAQAWAKQMCKQVLHTHPECKKCDKSINPCAGSSPTRPTVSGQL